jgi:hypothetical protein
MPIGSNILAGASGQTTGYDIEQSLRFNSPDSARLTRTAGTATSNDIGTFSFWIKRGLVSGGRGFFSNHSDASNRTQITFDADKIMMYGVIGGSGSSPELVTSQVFRDPAAWYHIVIAVDVTQSTASNRVKIYVNGSQVTDFSTGTYPPQDTDLPLFSKTNMQVGAVYDGSVGGYYDGYFAEYYYIDGQALAPSSFGETNEDTNQWQAIEYDGSYGDNGFYLKFQDSSALGDDSSGNTNDFTVTNLVASDQVTDSPTQNHATLNSVDAGSGTLSEGNLKSTGTTDRSATFLLSSGKWAWKVTADASGAFGVASNGLTGTESTYSASSSEVLEFELDLDANTLKVRVDGGGLTSVATGLTADAYVPLFKAACTCDFGQSGFSPTDGTFKTLNTDNLSVPEIVDPTKHFDTTLVSGNGSNRSITGLNFQPDFLWGKSRTNTLNHYLTDSVRGVNSQLYSDGTGSQGTETVIYTAFNSDGFSLGTGDMNTSGQDYVHWAWKGGGTASTNDDGSIDSSVSANTTAGFSIVKWTGSEASATIGHGLSQAPELIIVKDYDTTGRVWPVNVTNITGTANQYLILNATDAVADSSAYWGAAPGASTFTVGDSGTTNGSGSVLAYCFHSVEGYSKIGTYTGNGSEVFIYTGFKPAYLLVKEYATTSSWYIQDNKRNSYNEVKAALYANLNSAEDSAGVFSDFVSNGFVAINDGSSGASNVSGRSYIYLAFAESPFKYSNAR